MFFFKDDNFIVINDREPCKKPIGNNIKNIEIKVFFKDISDPKGMLKINLIFCNKIKDIKEKNKSKEILEGMCLIFFFNILK